MDTTEKCADWLKDFLCREGCVLCEIVRLHALKNGFGRKNLKAAKKKLGVKTYHQFDEDGATPNWFWYLPED